MTKHWQTSALGILTIVAALAHAGIMYFSGQSIDWTLLGGGFAAGIGFLRAADSNQVVEKPSVDTPPTP